MKFLLFFFPLCTRNANPGLLYIWTMSAFIFTFQTKQEGLLTNYFSLVAFIVIWIYAFVSCSGVIIFRNNKKGQRERLRVQLRCFQTELLRKREWGGCRWHLFLHPDAPSSMLPLLPELQVLSHLVAVGDRVTRACSVSHRRAPAPQGWSPLFPAVRSVLRGIFGICGICCGVPWS